MLRLVLSRAIAMLSMAYLSTWHRSCKGGCACVERAAQWKSLFRSANVASQETINGRLHYRVSEGE